MSPKRYVLTGSPCSGKTTLIQELRKQGFPTTREVAKELVVNSRIDKLYSVYPGWYFKTLLDFYLLYHKMGDFFNECFYDRGFPDILGMINTLPFVNPSKKVSDKLASELSKKYKYDKIFFLEPLKNYNPENHVGLTKSERQILGRNIEKRYLELGYKKEYGNLIYVPIYSHDEQISINARISQILNEI